MFVKNLMSCSEFTANDGCRIRELLHPKNESVDLPYSLAVARVAVGGGSYRHRLAQQEVYYIMHGKGVMHINSESREVTAGDVIHIPACAEQWIVNTGEVELEFAAIVSPPWRAEDDIRL